MEKMETYAAAGILGLVMSLMTVWVGWYVLTLVARWRIFDKAGIAGWKSLIPIYSDYCTYKIAWKTSFFWAMLVLGGVAGFIANRMGVYTDAGEAVPALLTALNSACGLAVTVINLLMRFYDVDGGSILIDGRDIRQFTRKELRDNFAMVLQDTWLFSGTIKENIAYGREGATNEEIIHAAKTAKAHHFIKALPGGYKMILNEDATNISEGQRQLLTIARAVLADKRLLILDEATSSVDTRTEEEIQKAMDALTEDRTSFIIAHRLSTIRNADLILVMEHGDIVEQGTHDELLAKGGAYAELYNSQFEEVG